MQVHITKCEDKNADWKVVSIFADNTHTDDVSINRINKKNETFPNFDAVIVGADIQGELWKSTAGKWYLFAPRPEGAKDPTRSPSAINKAMEKKEAGIEKAQDNKALGIKISATMGHAVSIVTTIMKNEPIKDEGVIKRMITEWRKWLWENWDKEEKDFEPFPSR